MTAQHHGRRGRPWRRIRVQVLKRDPYCTICGPKCTGISTTVDHVVALSVDPSRAHDLSNLRGACAACNYRRGAQMTNSRTPSRPPPRWSPELAPSGQPWRQTYKGWPCPVSNHGTVCCGGHLVDPEDWRPEWEFAATWPDGEFAPDMRDGIA